MVSNLTCFGAHHQYDYECNSTGTNICLFHFGMAIYYLFYPDMQIEMAYIDHFKLGAGFVSFWGVTQRNELPLQPTMTGQKSVCALQYFGTSGYVPHSFSIMLSDGLFS